MNITKKTWYKKLGWAGITLCGLCCALPVIGTAIGMASLTVVSFYLEKIGILSLVLAAFLFWYGWYNKRKKAKPAATSCSTNCGCKPATTNQTRLE